ALNGAGNLVANPQLSIVLNISIRLDGSTEHKLATGSETIVVLDEFNTSPTSSIISVYLIEVSSRITLLVDDTEAARLHKLVNPPAFSRTAPDSANQRAYSNPS